MVILRPFEVISAGANNFGAVYAFFFFIALSLSGSVCRVLVVVLALKDEVGSSGTCQ